MNVFGSTGDDKNTNFILDHQNKTLALGYHDGAIIQVTTEKLMLSKLSQDPSWLDIEMSSIQAHVYQNFLITASVTNSSGVSGELQSYEITVYRFDIDKIPEEEAIDIVSTYSLSKTTLNSVTLVRLVPLNTDPTQIFAFVGIGTQQSSILKVFRTTFPQMEEICQLDIHDILNEKSFVNDITSVFTGNRTENGLLVGLRNGTYHYVKWDLINGTSKGKIWKISSHTAGSEEVQFVPSSINPKLKYMFLAA